MADSAVEFMLGNLKDLMVYNAHLISSIKDEVQSLYEELCLLKTFVKIPSENRDDTFKQIVKKIRLEVYKSEDIVDLYVYYAVKHNRRGLFSKALHLPNYAFKLRGVAKEIEVTRAEVKEIYEQNMLTEVYNKMETPVVRCLPCVEEENVVGFVKEAEMLTNWLCAVGKRALDVISVVGMGGLGKTTLVKKVYNDPVVEYEFSSRSWVYVSQVYTQREVFVKILHDVSRQSKDYSQSSVEMLAEEVRNVLKERKYLIVLDDIWTKRAWDDLKIAFPLNKNGSRIVITSRNKDVAIHAQTTLPPYELKFLTDDESWELLEKKVFPRGTRCESGLVDTGKQIAKKCHGLPLAIVVIAGILKKLDKRVSNWEKVEGKVGAYVAMEPQQCMNVLALSYNHLPWDLKSCFLHFGVFPEDFEIPARKLMHIWVDEGFTQETGQLSAEEMAEYNLQDLVYRNLVMVEKRRSDGGIKTCRVHDMLRDICIKQAEEESFFKEIKGSSEQSTSRYVDPNEFRRVAVHSEVLEYISSARDASYVRSFFCYGKEETILPTDLQKHFPGAFQLLRVFDVLPIRFPKFPDIHRFPHLRHIALHGNFKCLPKSLSGLWNLQTVVIKTNSRSIVVEPELGKFLQLRHIYSNAALVVKTPSVKAAMNLRTMSKISPESCTEEILSRTPNLYKLGVRGKLNSLFEERKGSSKFSIITPCLPHLQKLKMVNDTYPDPPLAGRLFSLPRSYMFPLKLKKLSLSETMLNWKEVSVLGELLGLEVLKLGDNAFIGDHWVTQDGGFLSLRVLQIGETDLKNWEAAGGNFPQLQRLTLIHCEELVGVPSSLGDIPTLEVMEFSWSSVLAVRSARAIERNFKLVVFPPDQETQT